MKRIRDPMYGFMPLDRELFEIIDTPEFQRLENIRQLGGCFKVFSGADHSRKEHSLGVCHLATRMLTNMRQRQPQTITARDVRLVSIAALCHDIGHGPYSHVFDNEIVPAGLRDLERRISADVDISRLRRYREHEERSCLLVEALMRESSTKYTGYDVDMVQRLIHPSASDIGPLFQIVSNRINGLDVDRLDYIPRDLYHTGKHRTLHACYLDLIDSARVMDRCVCFPYRLRRQVFEVYEHRHRLHREVYQHPVVQAVSDMIRDALLQADPIIGLTTSIDSRRFACFTDSVLELIQASRDPALKPAQKTLDRLQRRQLYSFVGHVRSQSVKAIQDVLHDGAPDAQVIVKRTTFNFGNGEKNPLDKVRFFSSRTHGGSFTLSLNDPPDLPRSYQDSVVRIFVMNRQDKAAITRVLETNIDGFQPRV